MARAGPQGGRAARPARPRLAGGPGRAAARCPARPVAAGGRRPQRRRPGGLPHRAELGRRRRRLRWPSRCTRRGVPRRSRAEELAGAGVPVLVVQGARDAFGTPEQVRAAAPSGAEVVAVDGDHGLKRRPGGGRRRRGHLARRPAVVAALEISPRSWCSECCGDASRCQRQKRRIERRAVPETRGVTHSAGGSDRRRPLRARPVGCLGGGPLGSSLMTDDGTTQDEQAFGACPDAGETADERAARASSATPCPTSTSSTPPRCG